MQTGLVSIVIPVYNVEKYLEECLNSIINQTYKRIEVIIVNDGSTDSSLEICKHFQLDDRIIIIDKKNEGLSIARQVAVDNAKGEYLCIIDSDDYIDRDFIEKLAYSICKDNSDISMCASRQFTKSTSIIYGFSMSICTPKKILNHDVEYNYAHLLNYYYMQDSWAKIYRLDFIRCSGIKFYLNKEYNGTDLLFNYLLMFYKPKISVINNVLYNHRIHYESMVFRKDKKMQEGFQIIMSDLIRESNKIKYSSVINNQFSFIYLNLMMISAQDIIDSEARISEIIYKLKRFYILNKNYLDKIDRIKLHSSYFKKITNKLFSKLLMRRSLVFMYLYLRIRRFKMQLRYIL